MTCIALDDEPLPLKVLEHYINQLEQLECKGYFTNPEIARACLESNQIDLLFLDIQMPDLTGIEFFTGLEHKPLVIFSTAYREYAVEGFDLDAVDYLVKPYEFDRFHKAVEKAILYKRYLEYGPESQEEERFVFVKADYKVHKISLNDLYLVETLDDYLKLHLFS
ncbi:MAG: response regulator, partial [Bacteroidota bacterium]